MNHVNWTQPRKSYKSTQPQNSRMQLLATPPKPAHYNLTINNNNSNSSNINLNGDSNTNVYHNSVNNNKQQSTVLVSSFNPFQPNLNPNLNSKYCPYHFAQPTHSCITCRKSICIRCALTYCHSHKIYPQQQIIPILSHQLHLLYLSPYHQEINLKLKQSQQRQQYIEIKFSNLFAHLQQNFQHVINMLIRKKLQIMSYYRQQCQKFLKDYSIYDKILKQKLDIVSFYSKKNFQTIQDIDQTQKQIKNNFSSSISQQSLSIQKKITKLIDNKERYKIQKLWSQENLQKVLLQIEEIKFKVSHKKQVKFIQPIKSLQNSYNLKKKRVSTQASNINVSPFNSLVNKTSSNSKFGTGRKHTQH